MAERIIHQTTLEEAARIDRLAALAEQDHDDLVERFRLHALAAAEPTFRGELLRAIEHTTVELEELAKLAGVDLLTFDDFRCGTVELPIAAFERLARRLGFTLVKTSEHAPV